MITSGNKRIFITTCFYLSCFLPCFYSGASAQTDKQNIKFSSLSIKDGLSQSSPNCIFQDSRGFIWIGTEDGLNKYDGYNFTVFKPRPDDPFSLSSSRILSIAEDSRQNLWVGTNGGGVSKYDRKSNRFYVMGAKGKDSLVLNGGAIHSILTLKPGELWLGSSQGLALLDDASGKFINLSDNHTELLALAAIPVNVLLSHSGYIWIGTTQGLFRYDTLQKSVGQYLNNPFDEQSIPDNDVTALLSDDNGNIIIGTRRGLALLDINTDQLTRMPLSPQTNGTGFPGIKSLLFDNDGELWIATNAYGLYVGNLSSGAFTNYTYNHLNPYSIRNNEILSLFKDQSGIIWVGTNGIDRYNPKKDKFALYDYVPYSKEQLVFRNIHPIYQDPYGVLWIGSKSDGLHLLNRSEKTYRRYLKGEPLPTGLSSSKIRAIHEFPEGVMWVGTEDAGLNKVLLNGQRIPVQVEHYLHIPDNPKSISSSRIYALLGTEDGKLWIGTDNGLTILDPETGDCKQYLPDGKPGSISNTTVYAIFEDSRGIIWLATDLGINKYLPDKDQFEQIVHDPQDENSLKHNEILCFHEDKDGNLWIGTYGKGVDKFNPANGSFTHFTAIPELTTAVIYGILDDESGRLWMSTNNGLLRFTTETGEVKQFSIEDGLQSNEFNGTSYFKSASGELFFGGQYGFNSFHPNAVQIDTIAPKIVLTDLQVLNVSVIPGEDSPIRNHISEADEILLNRRQNNFTLYFSALHYANPSMNRYKYRLEGFDKEWIDVGTKRFVSYTNLPYKTYTFRVIASNSDGVWNNRGLSVKIRVKPPFWSTVWFRILAVIALAGLIYFYVRRKITAAARQKRLLEEKFEASSKELEDARQKLEQQHAEIVIQKRELIQRQKDHENLLWFNQGLGLFADMISKNRSDLRLLCHEVIEKLVEYVEAQQGGIYLLRDSETDEQVLELTAHFAYNLSRIEKTFMAGEGYIGTCFRDKEFLEIDNLTDNYAEFQSGLGKVGLKHLVLVPLKVNEECIGVVEIGSFKKIKGYRNSFIEKLMESFAATVHTEIANNKLKVLIDRTTAQAKELAENEEQMRQNLEEMIATQDEASRREDELIKFAEESATREEMLNQEIAQLKQKLGEFSSQEN
ncbi:MAG: GAF domain-containing protein [Bacteroidales bacterium]|nr:GAF domain-containing protein [Bacteroidales bacterium]